MVGAGCFPPFKYLICHEDCYAMCTLAFSWFKIAFLLKSAKIGHFYLISSLFKWGNGIEISIFKPLAISPISSVYPPRWQVVRLHRSHKFGRRSWITIKIKLPFFVVVVVAFPTLTPFRNPWNITWRQCDLSSSILLSFICRRNFSILQSQPR